MPKAPRPTLSPSAKSRECQICHAQFRTQGYKAHVKKCESDQELRCAERWHEKALEEKFRRLDALAPRVAIPEEPVGLPGALAATVTNQGILGHLNTSVAQTTGPSGSGGQEAHTSTVPYHRNGGRAAETRLPGGHTGSRKPTPPRNPEPWSPFFKSREDFEFSEILMKVGMDKGDSKRLIKIIRRCLDGKGSFNITKYSDVRDAWERASSR